MAKLRTLVIVLGDQLNLDAAAFDGFDPALDAVWMAEVTQESTRYGSSKQRSALFLSAMRHFALELQAAGRALHYTKLDAPRNAGSLDTQLAADLEHLQPVQLVMTQPGEWRVLQAIRAVALAMNLPLTVREDRHFLVSEGNFADHMRGRKALRMEAFYREQRKRFRVLLEEDSKEARPLGGRWNFDTDNRNPLPSAGLDLHPARYSTPPDRITREVITLIEQQLAHLPGSLEHFAWPVTRVQALQALQSFVNARLPLFGQYQDAMWPDEPWLYHAHLSAALNLKLLDPREVIAAAEQAYHAGQAPLASVEGFIRQILGWREYVRGVYWMQMPAYADLNALDAGQDLPAWYWNGATDFACLRDVIRQTLTHGYANHIQRLMVVGLYALLLGVQPRQIHAWFLAVYVDAVEWVELPNVLGMSQYADGGLMASKPYAATGKYIQRMSPYCKTCRYRPEQKTGEAACPFTTLYWDFLLRHEQRFAAHPRMALQIKNLGRLSDEEKQAVSQRAAALRLHEVGHDTLA
ncbi:cryptochrome/photolyase family protein [Craterilacuibacter sp.]|uniref:cryptochrome/photolyase family protein n=1 Tax=Craterilacuibacter sp. TaxID=2870909 RepID=UPI003F334CAD